MATATGYFDEANWDETGFKLHTGRPVSSYGATNPQEDWAESVAAVVFADDPQARADGYAPGYDPYSTRSLYVLDQFSPERDSRPPMP